MTKATKLAGAPAPTEPIEAPLPDYSGVTVRDVYAAQTLSAIVTGIVSRGGLAALESSLDDAIARTVFRLTDDVLRTREQ